MQTAPVLALQQFSIVSAVNQLVSQSISQSSLRQIEPENAIF